MPRTKTKRPKARRLCLELSDANWKKLLRFIDKYNANPERITPVLKYTDVINESLDEYLRNKEGGI